MLDGFLPSPASGRGAGERASASRCDVWQFEPPSPLPQPLSHKWERGANQMHRAYYRVIGL